MARSKDGVDTRRDKRRWSTYKPGTASQRHDLMKKCGAGCFLVPRGTPVSKGVPAYPICSRLDRVGGRCVVSCAGLLAAYNRLRQAASAYQYPPAYITYVCAAAERAVRTALRHADPADVSNACNWALRAWRKSKKPKGGK